MTCVTVFSVVSALAPGKLALTVTCGGTTLGYDSMPRLKIEITPASMIRIAITHAKIGWSMKKLDMPCASYRLPEAGALSCAGLVPVAGAVGAFASASGFHGTALAGWPDFARCTPDTTTLSPAASPLLMIQ